MLGWTKGAIRACNFAVSALSKTRMAFFAEPLSRSEARMPHVSPRYVDDPLARVRLHRLHADHGATGLTGRPRLHPLGANREIGVVHVPQGQ